MRKLRLGKVQQVVRGQQEVVRPLGLSDSRAGTHHASLEVRILRKCVTWGPPPRQAQVESRSSSSSDKKLLEAEPGDRVWSVAGVRRNGISQWPSSFLFPTVLPGSPLPLHEGAACRIRSVTLGEVSLGLNRRGSSHPNARADFGVRAGFKC